MNVVEKPSPHHSTRGGLPVGMVIIHADAGKSDAGTVEWVTTKHEDPTKNVSYHYFIGRDGTVYRFVPETLKAWHAGKSHWPGYSHHGSVNHVSIGVAFANDGEEPYRPVQYKVGAQLVAEIAERHGIPLHLIRGHWEVSPGRKTDPYKHFDWGEFYRLLGLFGGDKAA